MNWIYGTTTITEEDGDFVVSVRDLPEVVTSGDTYAQALELAADAIEVSIAGRLEDEMELPLPSPVKKGEVGVRLPRTSRPRRASITSGARRRSTKQNWRGAAGGTEKEARRILSPRKNTKLDQLAAAAGAGRRACCRLRSPEKTGAALMPPSTCPKNPCRAAQSGAQTPVPACCWPSCAQETHHY